MKTRTQVEQMVNAFLSEDAINSKYMFYPEDDIDDAMETSDPIAAMTATINEYRKHIANEVFRNTCTIDDIIKKRDDGGYDNDHYSFIHALQQYVWREHKALETSRAEKRMAEIRAAAANSKNF